VHTPTLDGLISRAAEGPRQGDKGHDLSTLIASLALAAIIAGEAPGCPFEAKLAVAHVAQRNPIWYGNAEPTAGDLLAALTWAQYPDPTHGALFLIGPGDAAKMAYLGKRTARLECNGTWLEAYKADMSGWMAAPMAEATPQTARPFESVKWAREFQ